MSFTASYFQLLPYSYSHNLYAISFQGCGEFKLYLSEDSPSLENNVASLVCFSSRLRNYAIFRAAFCQNYLNGFFLNVFFFLN